MCSVVGRKERKAKLAVQVQLRVQSLKWERMLVVTGSQRRESAPIPLESVAAYGYCTTAPSPSESTLAKQHHSTDMAAAAHLSRAAHSLLSCSAAAIRPSLGPCVAVTSARLAAVSHVLRSQASTSTGAPHLAVANAQRKGRRTRRSVHGRPAGLGALAGTLLSFSLLGVFGHGESASKATSPLESIDFLPQVSSAEVRLPPFS